MKRQPAAQVHCAQLHLRQFLFLSLALLLTLAAGQLHHNWKSAQAEQLLSAQMRHLERSPALRGAQLLRATDFAPVVPMATESPAPRTERWVF